MLKLKDLGKLKQVFLDHGWTWLTALNMMLFSLLHYPCGTTLLNIYKETKSKKRTFMSFAIPTAIAIGVAFLTATVARLLDGFKKLKNNYILFWKLPSVFSRFHAFLRLIMLNLIIN